MYFRIRINYIDVHVFYLIQSFTGALQSCASMSEVDEDRRAGWSAASVGFHSNNSLFPWQRQSGANIDNMPSYYPNISTSKPCLCR